MLTQVYELLIKQLHIIFLVLILSISQLLPLYTLLSVSCVITMVFNDYACITSVTEYSKSIRPLLMLVVPVFVVLTYQRFKV